MGFWKGSIALKVLYRILAVVLRRSEIVLVEREFIVDSRKDRRLKNALERMSIADVERFFEFAHFALFEYHGKVGRARKKIVRTAFVPNRVEKTLYARLSFFQLETPNTNDVGPMNFEFDSLIEKMALLIWALKLDRKKAKRVAKQTFARDPFYSDLREGFFVPTGRFMKKQFVDTVVDDAFCCIDGFVNR